MLEGYLTELLAKADVESPREKARTLWILSEGAMVMTLITGDRSYIATAERAARMLVRSRSGKMHRSKPHSDSK